MNAKKLLALWGLKWNPFSPDLPSEALLVTAPVEHFAWCQVSDFEFGSLELVVPLPRCRYPAWIPRSDTPPGPRNFQYPAPLLSVRVVD